MAQLNFGGTIENVVTVSYTHLDVYKRQFFFRYILLGM